MQSTASCAWQADDSIDVDYARKILLCSYAELCRNAHRTASMLAKHSHSPQSKPSPRQMIDALRHEIAGDGGTVQTLRPLLEYVLVHRKLPTFALVAPPVVERLFQHFAGARQLTQGSNCSSISLGDALFDCLTRGCRLCGRSQPDCDTSLWSLSASQQDAATKSEDECQCALCSAVRLIQANWTEINACSDPLQAAVLAQCNILEERISAIELVLHNFA